MYVCMRACVGVCVCVRARISVHSKNYVLRLKTVNEQAVRDLLSESNLRSFVGNGTYDYIYRVQRIRTYADLRVQMKRRHLLNRVSIESFRIKNSTSTKNVPTGVSLGSSFFLCFFSSSIFFFFFSIFFVFSFIH